MAINNSTIAATRVKKINIYYNYTLFTYTMMATRTWWNKRFNDQNNSSARSIKTSYIS